MQVVKVWLCLNVANVHPYSDSGFFRDPHMTKHSFVFWLVNLEKSTNILHKLSYLKPPYNIKTWIQISRLLYDFPLKIQHVDVKGIDAEHTKK
jgi:hypothetical protein